MLFLRRKNPLEHATRCRIVIGEIDYPFTVAVDGHPFGDKVFLDHFYQCPSRNVLGVTPTEQSLRRKIRLSPYLHYPLGKLIRMGLFLVRMLQKLLCHAMSTQTRSHEMVSSVSQNTDEFCGQGIIQQLDNGGSICAIAGSHGSASDILTSTIA